MARTYTVALPKQPRELRYTRAERLDFERRFRDRGLSGMKEILDKLVLPTRDLGNGKREITLGGDLEAQETLVWLGLRHINGITEKRVAEWLDVAAKEEGRPMIQFVAPAVAAVFASGVLGYVYEYKVETEEEVAPATEGKAEGDPETV